MASRSSLVILIALYCCIKIVLADPRAYPCESLPRDNYTCTSCIQFKSDCAWCSTSGYDSDRKKSRCDTFEHLKKHGCRDIHSPVSESEILQDESLANLEGQTPIQLQPQRIKLTLRPKDKQTFSIRYRQAVDYPLDLYYLMDLSDSMRDDKKKIIELGDQLANRMKTISKNFRLGFGSFVDKKLMPFVDPREFKHAQTCDAEDLNCEPLIAPYSFRNHLQLTADTDKFQQAVEAAQISGNLDSPEGGLDAVIQALVCEEQIGWREKSRRMLVYSSDAGFHSAGDARLAGLGLPNDGLCHMRDGYYSKWAEHDYPSIELMHGKIRTHKMNLIFAVTENREILYDHLVDAMPGVTASVSRLSNDSRNIVDLIGKEYESLSDKISMTDNSDEIEGLQVTYKTMCKGEWRDVSFCEGIKKNDEIIFNVTLELNKCTDKRDILLKLNPAGLSDTVVLDIETICECTCSQTIDSLASECNRKGDMVCGVCKCRGTNVGRHCECDAPGQSTLALDEQCKRTNDSVPCEGLGVCDCGECKCKKLKNPQEIISGQYCECDNFQCPKANRKLCGGNGDCVCRNCYCNAGWTGRACDCPLSQESCRAPNGKICNGQGECKCGKCKCFTDSEGVSYSGLTCEICATCPSKCDEFRACVMCQQFGSGPHSPEECVKCKFQSIPIAELPQKRSTEARKICQYADPADDCTFYFMYEFDEGAQNTTVWVKVNKDCPPPVPVFWIIFGVVCAILLIGLLLLLIWKIWAMHQDRKEYAEFEKSRQKEQWLDTGNNPLYTPATSTFKNPTYTGQKQLRQSDFSQSEQEKINLKQFSD